MCLLSSFIEEILLKQYPTALSGNKNQAQDGAQVVLSESNDYSQMSP